MKWKEVVIHIGNDVATLMAKTEAQHNDFLEMKHSFSKHKDVEEKWQRDAMDKIQACPESEHIKNQNGKLDTLTIKLNDFITAASAKKTVGADILKWSLAICTIIGCLIAYLRYANSGQILS